MKLGSVTDTSRNPWLTALLSLAWPGLGQAYVGRTRRGLLLFAVHLGLGLAGLGLGVSFRSAVVMLVGIVGGLFVQIVAVIDGFRLARRTTVAPRWTHDRWYAYAVLAIAWAAIGNPMLSFIKGNFAQAYRIPSESMEPTILLGDWMIVVPTRDPFRRGALVIFPHEGNTLMKRVVAIGGDTVAMRDGVLSLGGRMVGEPYIGVGGEDRVDDGFGWQNRYALGDTASYRPSINTWGPLVVPAGHLFVLGDNRAHSRDSRHFGFISADSARQTPRFIYFSWDGPASAVRWFRIGQRLD